ncbi:hypothetical protein BaRGS_00026088 [Batillaria attramentaria]|uniref:Uncharacterized protein n=1 Tax=Batillaria attramentaria TaxID=370345 RepID=A0ABD0K5W6_9CAEN
MQHRRNPPPSPLTFVYTNRLYSRHARLLLLIDLFANPSALEPLQARGQPPRVSGGDGRVWVPPYPTPGGLIVVDAPWSKHYCCRIPDPCGCT